MLKGHVFSKQLFGNPIFALFINTFLNGENGVSDNYKNGMAVTYNGSAVTIDSGAVCIQGRLLEEDSTTQVAVGSDTAYCKLVVEINLDNQNTESDFTQGYYKVVKSASNYPTLTQTNIVKNNTGIYQYELARFKTNSSGITDFQDMRTFLDFSSIYNAIQKEYKTILNKLQLELENVEDGSAYILRTNSLKHEVNLLKNKIENTTNVASILDSMATEITNEYLSSENKRTTKIYWRNMLDVYYIDNVRKIIDLLSDDNEYKLKLENWITNINIYTNSTATSETNLVLAQSISELATEQPSKSFIVPASTSYPDNSLLTIILDLYSTL